MKIQPLTESENETEEEIEIANTARRVVKLLQMFDNEPYESDNEYLDESDDVLYISICMVISQQTRNVSVTLK